MATNREKLSKKITNEELAYLFAHSNSTQSCQYCIYENIDCARRICYNGILQWLNQESGE